MLGAVYEHRRLGIKYVIVGEIPADDQDCASYEALALEGEEKRTTFYLDKIGWFIRESTRLL